jgi:hypothetical protein
VVEEGPGNCEREVQRVCAEPRGGNGENQGAVTLRFPFLEET